jgi:hypothetical protein
MRGHTSFLRTVAFLPNGSRIASGSADKTIRIWDVQTAKQTHRLDGHTSDVHFLPTPIGSFLGATIGRYAFGSPGLGNQLAIRWQRPAHLWTNRLYYSHLVCATQVAETLPADHCDPPFTTPSYFSRRRNPLKVIPPSYPPAALPMAPSMQHQLWKATYQSRMGSASSYGRQTYLSTPFISFDSQRRSSSCPLQMVRFYLGTF